MNRQRRIPFVLRYARLVESDEQSEIRSAHWPHAGTFAHNLLDERHGHVEPARE